MKSHSFTDLEVSYKLPLDVTVSMGASNLFNKYPDKLSAAFVAACVAAGAARQVSSRLAARARVTQIGRAHV